MEVVIRFMQAKKDHPDYKKNQICALIGVSDSYLKRVMKDLDIKSFYRYDIPVHRRRSKKEQKVGQKSDNGITEIAAHVETPSTDEAVTTKKGRKKKEGAELTGGQRTDDEYIDSLIRS